ncbi:MAG: class I SAM-dependent methyltransferase [Candidatus Omnitrophica bacterium]|nr:class I SAM-dependent methyltransferase [Candidatus Omnitrophota bacterium]
MSNKKCYLCQGENFSQRPGSVRDNSRLKILECTSCGLVFLSSFSHIENDFYENSNMHMDKSLKVDDWIKRTEVDDQRRFEFLEDILPQRSLLDFGCGTGNFITKASCLTNKVFGLEPEMRLREHFDRMSLKVYRYPSEIPKKDKFDIITLFHVLEHLPDPRKTLTELSGFLNKKGEIIIEVPSADDALLTLYNSEEFSHFTYWSCHLFLFNNKTLKKLAEQIKLKINYIKPFQRYPLSNHLFWLSQGKPGGHEKWNFIDSKELSKAYEKQLESIGKCDSVLMSLSQ